MNQRRQRELTEQIWRELSDRLRQFVRSRITSASDVDDVLQTVFLSIHSRLKDLREVDRLESWVFQITRNAVTDHFRKQRKMGGDVESLEATDISDIRDDDRVRNELAGCLSSFVQQLPTEQRRALAMYEFEGISQVEIARRESMSLSTVKSRVQRGRKLLESMLKTCCEFQFDVRGNLLDYRANDNCCDGDCDPQPGD